MTTTDLQHDLEVWLASQHATLWGKAWEVQNPKSCAAAASWLLDVLIDLRQDGVLPPNFFKRARRNGQ